MTREEYLRQFTAPTPEKYCEYCGKKLERKRYNGKIEDMGAFKKRKYCNQECMRKAFVMKGESKQRYSCAHHSAREIVYVIEKRPKICELCGSTKNVDVHHRDGNYKNNSSENLILVCRSCHMKLHRRIPHKCKVDGCDRNATDLGFCNLHYIRYKKYGDPLMYFHHKVGGSVHNNTPSRKMFVEQRNESRQLELF